MAKRSSLVINDRVYEILKCLLDKDAFVETTVDTTSRNFARAIVVDGQYIISSTVEMLLNWGVLEFRDDVPALTEKGEHMLKTGEGLRIESKKPR